MNLAALSDELQSKTPANAIGWLATNPTVSPFILANPITIFGANNYCTSKNSEPSTILFMIFLTSYGCAGSDGKILLTW